MASPAEVGAMRRALRLAASGLGSTAPNPSVGAVVLDADGAIAGEGRTAPPGGPHAEVTALSAAGGRAWGATVVSTLEPCAADGRTPPCTKALLDAGVARVVYALADPMPPYAGGASALALGGVTVEGGLLAEAAELVHGPWRTAVARGWPFVTLKYAATLDGRVAAADGTSRWITSDAARADVHALRGRVDAVLVGSGTVLTDDPALTVRGGREPRYPLRVVLDRRGRVPRTARVLDDAAPSLVIGNAPDLAAALKLLYAEHGIRHVLVEGGPSVSGALFADGLVDEVVAYLAPTVLGSGLSAIATGAFPTLAAAVPLAVTDLRAIGRDIRVTARAGSTAGSAGHDPDRGR